MRTTTHLSVSLVATLLMTACAEAPTGTSPFTEPEPIVAATLDEMALQAASVGDDRSAAAFAGGALALRFGVEPSELIVKVDGSDVRYLAVMTGIVESGSQGELGNRSLVAWTAQGAPAAFLQVDARSDAGVFDPSGLPGDPGIAKGVWADLSARARYAAEEGSSYTTLNSAAGRCPGQPAGADPRVICQLARFDVRLDGTFVSLTQPTVRVNIAIPQQGVSGALLQRQGGGDPVRGPTAQPGRPLPGI
jgi:hypothetical protein